MKIILPGGSGEIGTLLARALAARGDEVVVLSRTGSHAPPRTRARTVLWDGATLGPWADEIEGSDVVINLAGRSVNCRYTPRNRKAILDSRIDSTLVLGEAMAQVRNPPKLWLQSSTATIYSHRFDAANDEATGILGGSEPNLPRTWRFSIDVAKAWEKAAREANLSDTRLVLLRTAIVLSPQRGGVFDTLLGLVRRGLGGSSGDGLQYLSWIHDQDFVAAIERLIDDESFEGPVNIAAPHPLTNREFMKALRVAWGTRLGLPANRLMLEIGAFLLGSETELILKSRRVVPGRLLEAGFEFGQPHWQEAALELCHRWRLTR